MLLPAAARPDRNGGRRGVVGASRSYGHAGGAEHPEPRFREDPEGLELRGYEPVPDAPRWLADNLANPDGGELVASLGDRLDAELMQRILDADIASVAVFEDEDAFIVRRGEVLTEEAFERLVRAGVSEVEVYSSATFVPLRGTYEDLAMRRDWSSSPQLAADVVAEDTGEVLAEEGARFDASLFAQLKTEKAREALVFTGGPRGESPLLRNTLAKDPTSSEAAALHSIYSLVRPGEAPNLATARGALDRLFFNPKRYDLGRVGRHKINHRLKDVYRLLGLEIPGNDLVVLDPSDFVAIIRYLVELHEGRGYTDDIDHLGNRRVRTDRRADCESVLGGSIAHGAADQASGCRINNDPEKITTGRSWSTHGPSAR